MKNLLTKLLFVLLLICYNTQAQETIDRIGDGSFNESTPVMTVRTNGNILIASQTTLVSGSTDINILLLEYSGTSGTIIRQFTIGESDIHERPVDIIEEPNGNILLLGKRQGQSLNGIGSVNRQHGFLLRLQNSGGASFSIISGSDIIPRIPNGIAPINDYEMHPMKMRLDVNGNIIVVGNTISFIETAIGTISYSTWSWHSWTLEYDGTTLLRTQEFHDYPIQSPNQLGNVLLLPNTDILTTGYSTLYGKLKPVVTIMDNTMSTVEATSIPIYLPDISDTSIYSNLYQSALWNDRLVLVGDYIITNTSSHPHNLVIALANINANRTVQVTTMKGYFHPASIGGTLGDGNLYNDFHDFRVADILVNGNELIVLGIFRDKHQSFSPSFAEYCIMSVDLQTLNSNYCYVFNDMTTYSQNLAQRILVDNSGDYIFSGSRNFGSDLDLIYGKFGSNTKLECITSLEIESTDLGWTHQFPNFINNDSLFYEDTVIISNATPDIANSNNCSEGEAACDEVIDYVFYPDNSVIFTNTVWGTQQEGTKYYINGTLTVQDVTLDITNCDIVFGECGEIVFTGENARLRANNSVFRPCEDDVKWGGLIFEGGTTHKIIECVFKNALNAIEINDSFADIDQIVNNTFHNNYIGIHLNGAIIHGSITGNFFEVNNPGDSSFYTGPECSPLPNPPGMKFQGIRAISSVVWSPISDNDFVANDPLNLSSPSQLQWGFDGIYFDQTVAVIQRNKFTNNSHAIVQWGNSVIQPNFLNKIDQNEISLNRALNRSYSQIAVVGNESQSINCLITNNKIVNNRRLNLSEPPYYVGIGLEACHNAIIQQNYVQGFHLAMIITESIDPEISLNEFKGNYHAGIFAGTCEGVRINCNEIDLQFSNSSTDATGISLNSCDVNMASNSTIHSNCVYNTEVAIQIYGPSMPSDSSSLPSIMNNFLYNYLDYGLLIGGNVNYVNGSIGIGVAPGAMNTFARHNGAGIDIHSDNIPRTAYGNFFATSPLNIGPFVTVSGAIGNYHSVAACGQQVTGPMSTISGEMSEELKCDPNGSMAINPNGEEEDIGHEFVIQTGNDGSEFMNLKFFGYAGANAYGIANDVNYVRSLEKFYKKGRMTQNNFNICMAQYYQANRNYKDAIVYWEKVNTYNNLQEERKLIELTRLQILGKFLDGGLIKLKVKYLEQIIKLDNSNFNQANYVLSLIQGQPEYRIYWNPSTTNEVNGKLSMTEYTQLNVYPNPVVNELTVEVLASTKDVEGSGVDLRIMDVTGMVINNIHKDIVAGKLIIDVSNLPYGMYFMNVIYADSSMKTVKFVKAK